MVFSSPRQHQISSDFHVLPFISILCNRLLREEGDSQGGRIPLRESQLSGGGPDFVLAVVVVTILSAFISIAVSIDIAIVVVVVSTALPLGQLN